MSARRWFRRPLQTDASNRDGDDIVTDPRTIVAPATSDAQPQPVRLRVPDVDALRHLAVVAADVLTQDARVRVDRWEAPFQRWRGAIGPLPRVRYAQVSYDAAHRTATVHVTLEEPLSLARVINACVPALTPDAPMVGAGFPLLAVDPSAGSAVLPLLPGRRVPQLEPIAPALAGVHLRKADVLLTAQTDLAREAEDAVHQLTVGEALLGSPRVELPVVDLNVHNPIGRLLGFQPSPPARRLVLDRPRGVARLEAADPTGAEVTPIEFPVADPLSARDVAALRGVEAVDLSPLRGVRGSLPEGLTTRFAELAAAGVILHSLPDNVEVAPEQLSPRIVELARQRYRPSKGLARERRSVALRRAAMHDHGGFMRLASAVQHRTGHRYLPSVSVVLSTMRAELIPDVLKMMAAQTYPHVEVVVVAHGVAAPDLTALDLGDLDVTVVEVPGTVLFGAALAEGVRRSSGDLVTKLDDDDWYSEHHVFDLVLAHLYSRADVVGKTTEYLYFEEAEQTVHRTFATERYHDQVAGGAMLLSRATFDALGGWRPTPNSTDRSVLIRVESQGGIGYRTHSLGYMYIRHSSKHTWERSDSQLLNGSFEQWRGWREPEA
ncbi:glycosyltransferase [Microbacterium marinilacus]|uniref:Glycosyltransferase 2-like domain-containing protein n=1 Tax=Microbacterium marinilacus TaxID=415209 RepID=A0ABP7B9M4_9MICO|nr:glycosyltransferase [Microbacterium marinilacus]MBY0687207.1 glycosyltransferase family 2 protein [Microbacterium marinilacus]